MHVVVALALIAALAVKLLLRAHHGPPRRPWERQLTKVAAALAVISVVLFVLDAEVMAKKGAIEAPRSVHPPTQAHLS